MLVNGDGLEWLGARNKFGAVQTVHHLFRGGVPQVDVAARVKVGPDHSTGRTRGGGRCGSGWGDVSRRRGRGKDLHDLQVSDNRVVVVDYGLGSHHSVLKDKAKILLPKAWKEQCCTPHLSKRLNDLKQNGSQEKTPFSSTVFNTFSHGVIRLVSVKCQLKKAPSDWLKL